MRLIDSDALIERLEPYKEKYGADEFPYYMVHEAFIYEIGKESTVDAVPVRHGKWTRHTLGSTGYGTTVMHQCSECESMTISRFRYCPNCGARMDADD